METKTFTLQNPTRLAELYGNDRNRLIQALHAGAQGKGPPIDPTSALLASMLIAEAKKPVAPDKTLAQEFLSPDDPSAPPAGLDAIAPQGGGMPAPQGPQMASAAPMGVPAPMGQPPVGMAAGGMTELPASSNGGLTTLPLPDDMYNEESFAGGGIVAFASAGGVNAKAERRKALMSVMSDPDSTSEMRMAARAELNKLEGMSAGAAPSRGLADALAYTYEGPRGMDLLNKLDEATGAPVGGTRLDPSGYKEPTTNLFRNAEAAQRGPQVDLSALLPRAPQSTDAIGADGLTADYSLEADYPRVTAGPNKGKTLAELTAAARAANKASGQVPFKGLGRALLPIPERQALEAKERAEAQARTITPSGSKSDLGRVNMEGFNPEASSPEAQLNAILGKTPAAPGLPSLLPQQRSPAPASVPRPRASGAPVGDRGVVTPNTAASSAPGMSDEELLAKRAKDFEEANKIPAPPGTSAEEKAARKNEDLWSALAQIGFGMAAGENPNFLTNVGKATAAAVPGMQESLKERRAETKEELKQQYAYQLAKAGIKGKAYEFGINQFDKLKDNKHREATLAETIRHNQAQERLSERQIAQAGSTGTERLMADWLAADPARRGDMKSFFEAQSAFGAGKLDVAQETALTKAYADIDDKYKDQLRMLSYSKSKKPELELLERKIAQEKRAAEARITSNKTYTYNPKTGNID